MNKLIEAAKAVIDDLDNPRIFNVRDSVEQKLRAAVERAEKQEAMSELAVAAKLSTELYKEGYEDGQQAERERIKEIVRDEYSSRRIDFGRIMERIDAAL